MYFLQTRTRTLGWFVTSSRAKEALSRYYLTDRTGVTAWISSVSWSTILAPILTVGIFVGMGIMLAWRG